MFGNIYSHSANLVFAECEGAQSCWSVHSWFSKCRQAHGSSTPLKIWSWYTLTLILTPFSKNTRSVFPVAQIAAQAMTEDKKWLRILLEGSMNLLVTVVYYFESYDVAQQWKFFHLWTILNDADQLQQVSSFCVLTSTVLILSYPSGGVLLPLVSMKL